MAIAALAALFLMLGTRVSALDRRQACVAASVDPKCKVHQFNLFPMKQWAAEGCSVATNDAVDAGEALEQEDIIRCLCYAYLNRACYTNSNEENARWDKRIGKLDQAIVIPSAAAPGSCTVGVSVAKLDIPSTGNTVAVTVTTDPGVAVTVKASRSDATSDERDGTTDDNGQFVATYVFDVKATEGADGIAFQVTPAPCKSTRVQFKRLKPGVRLVATNNPLLIDPDGQATLTLQMIGTGTVQWTALRDGQPVVGPRESVHQTGLRMIPFSLPPGTSGDISASVHFPTGLDLPTNSVRVIQKPRAGRVGPPPAPPFVKGNPFCDAGKTQITLVFQCDNPDAVPIEVRGKVGGTKDLISETGTGNSLSITFPLPPYRRRARSSASSSAPATSSTGRRRSSTTRPIHPRR